MARRKNNQSAGTSIEDSLCRVRTQFGSDAAREKRRLLEALANQTFDKSQSLLEVHDVLLFMIAHPDNMVIRRLAEVNLDRISSAVPALSQRSSRAERAMRGVGLAGTRVESTFSFTLARHLANAFPHEFDIDWDEDGSAGAALDRLLHVIGARTERDGLYDSSVTTQEWFERAVGGDDGASASTGLTWLLRELESTCESPEARDHLFDNLELPLRWIIGDMNASRTHLRFPERKLHYQKSKLQRSIDIDDWLRKPIAQRPRSLPVRKSQALINTARWTLACRGRETDPVTHANPHEVYLFELERGINIAIYGMLPERRLPVESFFGYLLAKNGVPTAYGGGWVFLNRCEIGINVFPEMRGGESTLIFAQILRLYRHLFSVKRFTVDPYQFGADNDEGIQTGAFWFYRRFGFEPIDPDLRALANEEWKKIQKDRNYRSPLPVLRRLARCRIALDLNGTTDTQRAAPHLAGVGAVMTSVLGHAATGGDRRKAERRAFNRVLKLADTSRANLRPRFTRGQLRIAEQLAPLSFAAGALEHWSNKAKRDLLALLLAKGGERELDYVNRSQKHTRWRAFLASLADNSH